jgi:hypothetical protein
MEDVACINEGLYVVFEEYFSIWGFVGVFPDLFCDVAIE